METNLVEIYGAELVIGVFGYWPDFHDAEIVRMELRCTRDYNLGPTLTLDVRTSENLSNTAEGVGSRRDIIVTLKFDGVDDITLDGFNNQNALNGIVFKNIATPAFPEPALEITLDGVHGVSAKFRCRDVTVLETRPADGERANRLP